MKCPTCFSTMKCISEIHNVPGQPGRQRMDLHCYNRRDPREGNYCRARCHMGVITEDPKVWQCLEYSFGFRHKDRNWILASQDNAVDPFYQDFWREPKTTLSCNWNDVYSLPYFIPISTGDDMHEEAWKLFHRLRNLVIFS
jgi:hypothetical protein